MNICLITPPSEFLADNKVFMSLGILKVGAALEQAGHMVEHLDLCGVTNYTEAVEDYCRNTTVRTFGLTATSPQMPAACRIANAVKRSLPDARLVLGGPHPTLVNAAARLEASKGLSGRAARALGELTDAFDVLVAGDGERAMLRAITPEAPKLIDADDPKSDLWLTSEGFTESPWPARHLLDVGSYHYQVDGEQALSLVSQLGCVMQCTFCAGRNSPMLRRMRLRPPTDACSEVEHLYETYGTKGCMFFDDELNISRGMPELMRLLKESAARRGIHWALRGFLKAELFTAEQAQALYDAGFRQLLIGFESGHDRILTNIQKQATRAENTRAVEIAHAHGLKVKALMSIGHAGESEETILATRDWLLEVKPSDFDLTIITPYPGSPYYDSAEYVANGIWRYTSPKTGDHLYMEDVNFGTEAHYYKGLVGAYTSYVWTDHISRERLVELRDAVEDEVRTKLGIPFYTSAAAQLYEHSCGQTALPSHVLRRTSDKSQ
jgi:anaerobic magnesium-protoporphyrin IX monomethyl ester cyclase